MIKNICILGVGGVGGYFGAKMVDQNTGGYHITFIARGEHLRVIREYGLTLNCSEGMLVAKPDMATACYDDIVAPDLLIICTKSYGLAEALEGIKHKLKSDTVILPLLNGMDIPERIRSVLNMTIVLPACVYVGTHISSPGVISQAGGGGRILFGKDFESSNADISMVTKVFDDLGVSYEYNENVKHDIWKKFSFIAAYGIVGAVSGKTLGEVYASKELRSDVRGIMQEIRFVAECVGVTVTEEDIESSVNKAADFPPETKPSFQRDYEAPDKECEKDIFSDAISNLAKKYGVEIPVTALYQARL